MVAPVILANVDGTYQQYVGADIQVELATKSLNECYGRGLVTVQCGLGNQVGATWPARRPRCS